MLLVCSSLALYIIGNHYKWSSTNKKPWFIHTVTYFPWYVCSACLDLCSQTQHFFDELTCAHSSNTDQYNHYCGLCMLKWVSIGLNKCQNNSWVLGKYTDGTTNNRLMTCQWKRFYHDIVPQLHSPTRPTDHDQAGIKNAQSVFLVQSKFVFFFDILCQFYEGAIF